MAIDVMKVKEFHGHMCPGLAFGIRVSELALLEMGERPADEELIAIVESDNCAVDAIQFITGCTFGKGNLIHLDYGKDAYRFIRRSDGKAIRIIVKREITALPSEDEERSSQPDFAGTENEIERIRQKRIDLILSIPLSDLLEVQEIEPEIPPRARIFNSVVCERCGEQTMEIRLRLLNGKAYCPECFDSMMKVMPG